MPLYFRWQLKIFDENWVLRHFKNQICNEKNRIRKVIHSLLWIPMINFVWMTLNQFFVFPMVAYYDVVFTIQTKSMLAIIFKIEIFNKKLHENSKVIGKKEKLKTWHVGLNKNQYFFICCYFSFYFFLQFFWRFLLVIQHTLSFWNLSKFYLHFWFCCF